MHFFSFLVLFFQVTYIVVNSFSIPSSTILTNRKLKYERFKWEDQNLPFPNSIHEIVQVKSTSRHSSSSVSRPQFEHGRMTKSELTPLYPGYGTHFAYIYVGTPPQRQSVIIDTGSHYTAFPCTGCIQCGSHTDEYFDLKNSTTSKIQMCATDIPCPLSQSYSEGSMWKGFKVSDKLWVGGLSETLVQNAATFSTDFTFACQTTETGLFRTQLADGIMGMSIARDTIPSVLKDSGITDNSIFALCYRTGGGIMTLGGVDQRVHLPNQPLNYAKMSNVNGWYGLSLVDISLSERASTRLTKVPGVTDIMTNQGKHCIVDSGTTDTYFPVAIQKQFIETFSKITGINYSADTVTLTDAQVAKIPNIIFTFESYHETDNSTFSVMMPWTNYLDAVGGNKYTFRIYLSELNNVLLGANFMNGLNVIFDSDNNRVGFAKSNCRYEEFEMKATSVPTRSPHSYLSDDGTDDDNNVPTCTMVPTTPCNAQCDKVLINTGAIKEGIQKWEDSCGVKEVNGTGERVCHVSCYGPKLARGDVDCHDTPWSECDKSCLQTRKVKKIIYQYGYKSVKKNRQLFQLFGSNSDYSTANINDHSISHSHSNAPYNNKNNLHSAADDKCAYTSTPRVCYTGACPVNDGDYVMFIDMKVKINPQEWSYVHSEAFYAAFANIFKVKESSVDLLSDANNEFTNRVKLRFELRLKSKNYKSIEAFTNFAEGIPDYAVTVQFAKDLIKQLSIVSNKMDGLDHSRYGWMTTADIEVSNVLVLPKATARDPFDTIHSNNDNSDSSSGWFGLTDGVETIDLILAGVALGAMFFLSIMVCMYYRLRQEHDALEKDKVTGGSIRRMWDRFIQLEQIRKLTGAKQEYEYKELRMEEFSSALETGKLTAEDDTQLDVEDEVANRS